MADIFGKIDAKKTGIFAAGILFGTAGVRLLSGKDARKVYAHCTAAVLRAKECMMKTVTNVQENAEDIYAEAKQINADRESAEEVFEDASGSEEENDLEEESGFEKESACKEADFMETEAAGE